MLRGNKAIVTGGSRGIGYAIARELTGAGCSVVITGRSKEALDAAAEEIGGHIHPMVWDISEFGKFCEKVEETAAILGGLDIVVNNAGIMPVRDEWRKNSLLETTEKEWDQVLRTNAGAVFFLMKESVRYMLSHNVKGNILNIASVAGYEPVYGAYGASKTAVTGLTRGWGKMFAGDGIVINGIAPGPVATRMNHWQEGDSMEHDRIPFGRFAASHEVARLAMYLLDKDAEMVCGETVTLDGAYAIR